MTDLNQKLETLADRLDQRGRLYKRLRLLEAIDSTSSLTAAADLTGVCYKTAWNHLRDLSEEAGCKLVATSTGGASGGGSELTETGRQFLTLLRIRRTHNSHNRLGGSAPALRFSARNQLAGKVTQIDTSGLIANVEIRVGALRLISQVTRSSIDHLQLETGSAVYAIIKASIIKLKPPTSPLPSSFILQNRLPARAVNCESSAAGREVQLELAPGVELTAARPFVLQEEAWLYNGAEVLVVIDPTEIMLATAA